MKNNKTYLRNLSQGGFFPYGELRRHQYGFKAKIGCENEWKRQLYQSMKPFSHWDPNHSLGGEGIVAPPRYRHLFVEGLSPPGYGGIFNLEFSLDGRLLAAACQNRAIVLFDSLTRNKTAAINDAHFDCVNGIKFLDSRLFASCSDDQTVAVWDVRNLKQRVHSLRGHTKWVKNVEYHAQDNQLLTSGFDGNIIAWDINKAVGTSVEHKRLFWMNGLMRMKLSPDQNKLLLCTSGGYMILVMNLDLQHFYHDMKIFKDQMSTGSRPVTSDERSVMGRTRNKCVFLKDFPTHNEAEIIHSIEVHPYSWAVVSRNTSTDDRSEWTCVHDIQEFAVHDSPVEDIEEDKQQREQPCSSKVMSGDSASQQSGSGSDRESSSGRRGYYLVGDGSSTPRFEMLLDTSSGGNWLNVRSGGARSRFGTLANDHDNEEEDDEDPDVAIFPEAAAEERPEMLDDAESDMNNRQRAIMLGLNILIQRNATSDFNDLRTLGIDPAAGDGVDNRDGAADNAEGALGRYRRRGTRGRAGQLANISSGSRVGIERQRLLHRYRWRVNRRLNQLTQSYRDVPQNRDPAVAPPQRERQEADDRVPPRRINRYWYERNEEIRRTLRSLRSGLDIVMENLNSVRQQIDNDDLEQGFDINVLDNDLDEEGPWEYSYYNLRTTAEFYENYRSTNATTRKIYAQQRPRLTHHILEPNVGHGFIKELCFSSDGRLIGSPYKYGVRILAFDEMCSELSHCVSDNTQELHQVAYLKDCHKSSVVSTKFSPNYPLLVSGSLDGKITWHQPVL